MLASALTSDSLAAALRNHALAYAAEVKTQLRRAGRGQHTGIHRARKALARLRALLLLLRAAPQPANRLERQARAQAHGLSKLRDAQAACGIARRLAQRKHAADKHAEWRTVLALIVAERDRLLAAARRVDPGFAKRSKRFTALQATMETHDWSAVEPADVKAALHHAIRRARRARKSVRASADETLRHRLRRRARRALLQIDLLLEIAGDAHQPHAAKQAHKLIERESHRRQMRKRLVDRLGDERDLQLLRRTLKRLPHAAAVDHALRAIDERLPRAIAASNKVID